MGLFVGVEDEGGDEESEAGGTAVDGYFQATPAGVGYLELVRVPGFDRVGKHFLKVHHWTDVNDFHFHLKRVCPWSVPENPYGIGPWDECRVGGVDFETVFPDAGRLPHVVFWVYVTLCDARCVVGREDIGVAEAVHRFSPEERVLD